MTLDHGVRYDGDRSNLRELTAYGTVHIYRLHTHAWAIRLTHPDLQIGTYHRPPVEIHLECDELTALTVTGVPVSVDPPLSRLCHEWKDHRGTRHQCFKKHTKRRKRNAVHKCGCGAIKQIPPGTSGRPAEVAS